MQLGRAQAAVLMVAVTLMWSIAGVVTRQLDAARSFEVTFWRSAFTALSLMVILPLWKGPGVWRAFPWRSPYFWASGLCWCVMFTAFMVAMTLTQVANVLITLSLGPLLTALLTWGVLRQALPVRTWLAIVLAGAGMAWMFGHQMQLGAPDTVMGFMVALCVPMAGAVQWTLLQSSRQSGPAIDMVPSVWLGSVISSVLTGALSWPLQASAHDMAWLALLGVFQLAIPCVLSVVVAGVLKAPEVSLLALLEILFGIVWAWLWAQEVPDTPVWTGGAVVLLALIMNETLGRRATRD